MAYRVDGKNWKPMTNILESDPAYEAELYRWDDTEDMFRGRRPTEAAKCTHLWRAALPGNLPVGVHQIEVQATDAFGKTYVQTSSYRIEEPKF